MLSYQQRIGGKIWNEIVLLSKSLSISNYHNIIRPLKKLVNINIFNKNT